MAATGDSQKREVVEERQQKRGRLRALNGGGRLQTLENMENIKKKSLSM